MSTPPGVPLLRALWSRLDDIGCLKGQLGGAGRSPANSAQVPVRRHPAARGSCRRDLVPRNYVF